MFNGCAITRETDGGMKIDLTKYMSMNEAVNMDMKRKGNRLSKATQDEMTTYWKLTEELFRTGTGVLPQADCIGSIIQQRILSLKSEILI